MNLTNTPLTSGDLAYAADMMLAIVLVKETLTPATPQSIAELVESVASAEAALRRVAVEMKASPNAISNYQPPR